MRLGELFVILQGADTASFLSDDVSRLASNWASADYRASLTLPADLNLQNVLNFLTMLASVESDRTDRHYRDAMLATTCSTSNNSLEVKLLAAIALVYAASGHSFEASFAIQGCESRAMDLLMQNKSGVKSLENNLSFAPVLGEVTKKIFASRVAGSSVALWQQGQVLDEAAAAEVSNSGAPRAVSTNNIP